MKITSGEEYISSLKDGRKVWLDGEEISDVTTHRTLKPTLTTLARYYDMVNDPSYDDVLRFTSPSTGDRVSVFIEIPRSKEDLLRRRKALEVVMREFGGLMTRFPEYAQGLMVGIMDVKDELAKGDKSFGANVENWYVQMRESDAFAVSALNDPQIDRGQGIEGQGGLKVVERKADGVVVRGTRTISTNAPFANACLCLRKPVPAEAIDYCIDFVTPLDAAGLKIICRPSLGNGRGRGGLSSQYDEPDAALVFDDVLVPKENIVLLGTPEIITKTFGRVTSWSPYHDLIRSITKAELLLGITSLIVEYIGTTKFQLVMTDLTEMIEYVETLRTFARAAEADFETTPSGNVAPNHAILNMSRLYYTRNYPKMIGLMHKLSGQSLMTALTQPYFDQQEILPYLEKYFGGPKVTAKDKAKLFGVAWDLSCGDFAGRQALYELFNVSAEHTLRDRLIKTYDRSPYVELAKRVAGIEQ